MPDYKASLARFGALLEWFGLPGPRVQSYYWLSCSATMMSDPVPTATWPGASGGADSLISGFSYEIQSSIYGYQGLLVLPECCRNNAQQRIEW